MVEGKFENVLKFLNFNFRYDNALVYNEVLKQGKVDPKTIQNGVKLYKLQIPKTDHNPKTTFLDSYNFMPRPLDKLPEMMGWDILAKQFFPHKFYDPKNYGKVIQGLPDKEFYYYRTYLKKKRQEFIDWYEAHKHELFDLSAKLIEYCTNDVDILYESLAKYRQIFLKLTEVMVPARLPNGKIKVDAAGKIEMELQRDEIFLHCSTIASACIRLFRIKFLKDQSIPITPEGGYEKHDMQSKLANKYLR